jgi:hypothetical protein
LSLCVEHAQAHTAKWFKARDKVLKILIDSWPKLYAAAAIADLLAKNLRSSINSGNCMKASLRKYERKNSF